MAACPLVEALRSLPRNSDDYHNADLRCDREACMNVRDDENASFVHSFPDRQLWGRKPRALT